jgi:hypothetical protein
LLQAFWRVESEKKKKIFLPIRTIGLLSSSSIVLQGSWNNGQASHSLLSKLFLSCRFHSLFFFLSEFSALAGRCKVSGVESMEKKKKKYDIVKCSKPYFVR